MIACQVIACPFYGRAPAPNLRLLMPTRGNQCALISLVEHAHSPCSQELAGRPVCLLLCPVARDEPVYAARLKTYETA